MDRVKAFFALTKPRVIELLLVTTAPVMILAEGGIPDLWLVFWTLVGGSMSAGAAGAFNCYIDRDIDRVMKRTSKRPLVTGAITPREALVFSWVLAFASVAVFWVAANWLAAVLSAVAIFFYVVDLLADPEAPDLPEHHLGRDRRMLPGAHRLDRGHRVVHLGAGSSSSRSSSCGRLRTTGRCR
jgi:hypothetical protein